MEARKLVEIDSMGRRVWLLVVVLGCGIAGVSAKGQGIGLTVQKQDPAAKQEKQLEYFLLTSSEGGLVEVQFGQLAAQMASNPAVRAYAQKMVDIHTKWNPTLNAVVLAHHLVAPTGLNRSNQGEYDKMKALSGTDFDRAYLAFMMVGQHNELHQYRREAAITTDPTLKASLPEMVRTIFDYTHQVDALAGANGVPLPERTPVPATAAQVQ